MFVCFVVLYGYIIASIIRMKMEVESKISFEKINVMYVVSCVSEVGGWKKKK